jgi:hypothetical protein
MTTAAARKTEVPANVVGVVLFVVWGIAAIVWVASTISLAANGDGMAIVTAVATFVLLTFLAAAEGVEVVAIGQWKVINPGSSTGELARWLAARQLFVALIVTTVTLLANRSKVIVPWTGVSFDEELPLRVYDIFFVGLWVLWFAQILPKHLAATNPPRYLSYTRSWLFPIVRWVDRSGIPKPASWTALAVERRLSWRLTEAEEMQEAALPQPESLDHIWRELIPEGPSTGGAHGSPRESERARE